MASIQFFSPVPIAAVLLFVLLSVAETVACEKVWFRTFQSFCRGEQRERGPGVGYQPAEGHSISQMTHTHVQRI